MMKPYRNSQKLNTLLPKTACLLLWTILIGLAVSQSVCAAAKMVIWDTGSPLTDAINLENKSAWKAVPSDLLTLEVDPPKASSDPGYYGREYAFKGDAVVENNRLTAVFWSAKGRVVIYPKAQALSSGGTVPSKAGLGQPIAELMPNKIKNQPVKIALCEILRNAADEVVLKITFDAAGTPKLSAVFAFDRTEIVEIRPDANIKGFSLVSPIEYGIAPAFIGDDIIFGGNENAATDGLCVPAQNLFVGLVKGEASELVMTWPKGRQQLKLNLGNPQNGKRQIESIDFDNDGQNLYLAGLAALGLWHREPLTAAFLEKDVAIQWKPPFPARWTTQLFEGAVKATFAFRDSPGQIWRGVPGQYRYPVWFNGETANYHLSKKVPPKGESLVYFLEAQDTPLSIATPVDILKATLGRQMSESILDESGRQLRTHHRRGAIGVRRACTCGCTEAIQAIFEAGEECAKQEAIAGEIDDMIYFVRCHVERIDEYRRFADDLLKYLQAQKSAVPELTPYLESLEQIAGQIPQEYTVQKENMKSLEHAADLSRQTLALTRKKDPNNLKAYMELLKAWRAMGGAQDYVVAQCHTITRKLYQEAGYGCAAQSKAVTIAEEIQKRCRSCLRNSDGYEIWANY